MLSKALSRLSYANVMATIAVFMAMGGGAYALSIPKNSVGARQIKKDGVGASEIKAGAVRSSEVKNSSLLAKDFKAGQLPAGSQGATGAQGLPGVSGLVKVAVASGAQNSNSGKLAIATCPAGKRVIGTGAQILGDGSGSSPNELTDVVIDEVVPSAEDTVPGEVDVRAVEEEPTAVNWAIEAIALCANVS